MTPDGRSTGLALLLLGSLAAPPAPAQELPSTPFSVADMDIPTAFVEVDGVPLFRVRGVTSFPASERAAGVSKRIRDAARDPEVDPGSMRIEVTDLGREIWGGARRITIVLEADARIEGLRQNELAAVHLLAIQGAIRRYRESRTSHSLAGSAGRALAATGLLAALLALFVWLFRRIDRLVERRFRRQAEALEARSFELLRAERLRAAFRGGQRLIRAAIFFALLFVYLSRVLGLFPWTRFIAVRVTPWVTDPLLTMGRSILDSIPDLLFLAILTIVVRWGLKLLRLFFGGIDRGVITFEGFDAEWAWPTYKIVRFTLIAFAVVVAYPYIPGSSSGAFKGVSLFLGVILSLGSSTAVSNMIAGLAMTYRRAFRVGDRVKIGDTIGDVTDVRLQVTHLRTTKNEEVVIPNAKILNNEVFNYSTLARRDGLILHTTVGIGYEVPWRQVEAMLLLAAERTDGLKTDPAPFVLQKALADYAVNYELNVYCGDAQAMWSLYTALHRSIQDVFNEHGIQIMTPSYVADPSEPKTVPRKDWYTAPAAPPSGQKPPDPD